MQKGAANKTTSNAMPNFTYDFMNSPANQRPPKAPSGTKSKAKSRDRMINSQGARNNNAKVQSLTSFSKSKVAHTYHNAFPVTPHS